MLINILTISFSLSKNITNLLDPFIMRVDSAEGKSHRIKFGIYFLSFLFFFFIILSILIFHRLYSLFFNLLGVLTSSVYNYT
uniref:Uncharacterized protein n=1 Tax=Octopus bimaculoides TaxID=37653 RepID=A0A0L8I5S3_OCTBM